MISHPEPDLQPETFLPFLLPSFFLYEWRITPLFPPPLRVDRIFLVSKFQTRKDPALVSPFSTPLSRCGAARWFLRPPPRYSTTWRHMYAMTLRVQSSNSFGRRLGGAGPAVSPDALCWLVSLFRGCSLTYGSRRCRAPAWGAALRADVSCGFCVCWGPVGCGGLPPGCFL